ncbi:MAG: CBS domain-containing protein [Desulfoarculaceae bacterium]|nr:CBS domain-containing protein [Desulfoarculaceae bacterium]
MTAHNPVVRDFIIPLDRYPHLLETQTLHDAFETLTDFSCGANDRLRYSTIFITDHEQQLVGKLTLQDMLMALDDRFSEAKKAGKFEGKGDEYPNLTILWEDSFFTECAKKKDVFLKNVMRPVTRLVKADDSLVKTIAIMLYGNIEVLPVLDGDSIIGVIRLEELFRAVCSACKI